MFAHQKMFIFKMRLCPFEVVHVSHPGLVLLFSGGLSVCSSLASKLR